MPLFTSGALLRKLQLVDRALGEHHLDRLVTHVLHVLRQALWELGRMWEDRGDIRSLFRLLA